MQCVLILCVYVFYGYCLVVERVYVFHGFFVSDNVVCGGIKKRIYFWTLNMLLSKSLNML